MTRNGSTDGRRIVTCDDCGTAFAAIASGDDLVLVGDGGGSCPNCTGTEFSRLTL